MHYKRNWRKKPNYWRIYKDLVRKAYKKLVKDGSINECQAEQIIEDLLNYWVDSNSTVVSVNGEKVEERGWIKEILEKYNGEELVFYLKDFDEQFCIAFYPIDENEGSAEIYDPTLMDAEEAEEAFLAERWIDLHPQTWEEMGF